MLFINFKVSNLKALTLMLLLKKRKRDNSCIMLLNMPIIALDMFILQE